MAQRPPREVFAVFAKEVEPRLRYSLVAAYGPERGLEAVEEALIWAWEHWDRLQTKDNPAGYLYRVGQSRARRPAKRTRPLRPVADAPPPEVEPKLGAALASLSKMQRTVTVMVEGFGWSQREVAEFLGVAPSTVQKHLERGLAKLRNELGVEVDV